jgi:hypothetical protein
MPPIEDASGEHPGIAKIKKMYDNGDIETLEKMVRLYDALENLGALGGMLRRFIIWSGVIAGGYLAFSGYLVEWIRSIK